MLFLLENIGNHFGLKLFKAFIPIPLLILITLVFKGKRNIYWLLSTVLLYFGLTLKFYARASGFAPIFLGLVLLCFWQIRDQNNPKWAYFLLPIITVWSNIHGSFAIGFVLIFLFTLGLYLDELREESRQFTSSVTRLLAVFTLMLLSVVFVKPYPNYMIGDRFGAVDVFQTTDSPSNDSHRSAASKRKQTNTRDLFWPLRTLKTYTHDLIVTDRAFIPVEFTFSPLILRGTVPYLINLILLPLFFLLIVILQAGKTRFSTLLPVLFILWLGVGIHRATPFITAVVLPLAIIELTRFPAWPSSRSIQNGLRGFAYVILSLILVFLLLRFTTIKNFYRTESYFNPEVPSQVLKDYGEYPVYTSLETGSFVLWHWWPRKKVLMQAKTSAYKNSFLEDFLGRFKERNRILQHYNVKVAILGWKLHNRGRNSLSSLPGWSYLPGISTNRLHVYCRCDELVTGRAQDVSD